MERKQKLKFFFKFFGIGSAIAVGTIGLVSAYLGITGGFNPVIIEPTSMTFDINNEYYQKDTPVNEPVFVVSDDFCLKVNPDPENANQLDAKLKIDGDASLVKSIQIKNIQYNAEDENAELFVDAEKDSIGYYPIKLGEEFKVVLSDEHYLENERIIQFYVESQTASIYCRAKVWVDVKLESFELKFLGKTKGEGDNLFPTDEFEIGVDWQSVSPSVALSNEKAISQLIANGKTIEYEVTEGHDIVTIISTNQKDSHGIPKAKVKINEGKSGNFKITAHICDKYEHIDDYEYNHDKILNGSSEDKENYYAQTYGGTIMIDNENEQTFEGFMISSSYENKSEPLAVDNITAVDNIEGLYLFKTYGYSPADLEIKINPKEISGSHYTSDDLKSYINDLKVKTGVYVNSPAGDGVTIEENGVEKYIQFTDRYLGVIKEADGNGGFQWLITVKEYTLNNCLVFVLEDYISEDDDSQNQGSVETKYCVIDVEVLKNADQSFGIMIRDLDEQENLSSQKISLSFDSSADEQIDFYDLSQAKLVLTDEDLNEPINSNNVIVHTMAQAKPFSSSNSDYKTTLFVTKDANDKYSFENDIIKIEDGKILPVGTGRSYLYAILIKTNADGKAIDADGNVIVDESEILAKCHVEYTTTAIVIDVYQVLRISKDAPFELYQLDSDMVLIEDDDESFQIEKQNNQIISVKVYKDEVVYLKLSVNDQSALSHAFEVDDITYETDNDLISVNKITRKENDKNVYYLSITVVKTSDLNASGLTIKYKEDGIEDQIHLTVYTRDYTLESIELTSNGVKSEDETVDAVVKLSLFENSSEYYWTASNDLSEERELVVTTKINPSKANINTSEINYTIYSYPDFDIHEKNISEIINQLTLSNDIIEFDGDPQFDGNNQILKFTIRKAGKAVVIASYTLDNGVIVYSNAFVIETIYPYFEVDEFNHGTNRYEYRAYEQVDDEKYRILTTTYNDQKTDLIDFTPREKQLEQFDTGYKFKLKYKYSDLEEIEFSSLNVGLYDFDIQIIGESHYTPDDFQFVCEDGHQYLITPRVSEKVYLKISISTKFGYPLSETYNYVLQPDYNINRNVNIEIHLSEFENQNRVNLFDYLIENDEIIDNNGLLFITNSYVYSNYCEDNTEHLTGGGTEITKVIYLPLGTEYDENEIPEGYEIKAVLKLNITDPLMIVKKDNSNQSLYINDVSQIETNYVIGYKLSFKVDENTDASEIVVEGSITILVD